MWTAPDSSRCLIHFTDKACLHSVLKRYRSLCVFLFLCVCVHSCLSGSDIIHTVWRHRYILCCELFGAAEVSLHTLAVSL